MNLRSLPLTIKDTFDDRSEQKAQTKRKGYYEMLSVFVPPALRNPTAAGTTGKNLNEDSWMTDYREKRKHRKTLGLRSIIDLFVYWPCFDV